MTNINQPAITVSIENSGGGGTIGDGTAGIVSPGGDTPPPPSGPGPFILFGDTEDAPGSGEGVYAWNTASSSDVNDWTREDTDNVLVIEGVPSSDLTDGGLFRHVATQFPWIVAAEYNSGDTTDGSFVFWNMTSQTLPFDGEYSEASIYVDYPTFSQTEQKQHLALTPTTGRAVFWQMTNSPNTNPPLFVIDIAADEEMGDAVTNDTVASNYDIPDFTTLEVNDTYACVLANQTDVQGKPIVYNISGDPIVHIGTVAAGTGDDELIFPLGCAFHPTQDKLIISTWTNAGNVLDIYDYGADPTFATVAKGVITAGIIAVGNSTHSWWTKMSVSPDGTKIAAMCGDADGNQAIDIIDITDSNAANWSSINLLTAANLGDSMWFDGYDNFVWLDNQYLLSRYNGQVLDSAHPDDVTSAIVRNVYPNGGGEGATGLSVNLTTNS